MRVNSKDLVAMERGEYDKGGIDFITLTQKEWDDIKGTIAYYDNMAGEKFIAPNLSQATPTFLVDEFGLVKDEIKPRQTYEKMLGNLLKGMRPESNFLAGEKYNVTFKFVSKLIMDQDKIAAFVKNPAAYAAGLDHPMTLADLMKPSEYWEARTSPRGKPEPKK